MAGPWRNRAHTVLSQGKSLVPSWGPQASTRWFLKSSKRGRQLGSVQHALPTGLQWGEGAMGAGGGGGTQHTDRETARDEHQRQARVSGDEMNQTPK